MGRDEIYICTLLLTLCLCGALKANPNKLETEIEKRGGGVHNDQTKEDSENKGGSVNKSDQKVEVEQGSSSKLEKANKGTDEEETQIEGNGSGKNNMNANSESNTGNDVNDVNAQNSHDNTNMKGENHQLEDLAENPDPTMISNADTKNEDHETLQNSGRSGERTVVQIGSKVVQRQLEYQGNKLMNDGEEAKPEASTNYTIPLIALAGIVMFLLAFLNRRKIKGYLVEGKSDTSERMIRKRDYNTLARDELQQYRSTSSGRTYVF